MKAIRKSNKTKVLDRTRVEKVISDNKGKFFSCEFTKKDGSVRKIHGRTGVKKYLKGGVNKVQKQSNSLMTVWEKEVADYRSVNLNTMTKLTLQGVSYRIK